MSLRGVRGATIVAEDTPEAILSATSELLKAMLESNPGMELSEIGSAIFTLTADLKAAYPAQAARQLGWESVPMLCAQEIPVPQGMQRCLRVLLQWNTELPQSAIHHVYLGQAAFLRPDISQLSH